MHRLLVSTAIVLGCLAGLLIAPASVAASTQTVRDKIRDAPARVDITKVTTKAAHRSPMITVQVRNLSRRGALQLDLTDWEEAYRLIVRKPKAKRAPRVALYMFRDDGTHVRIRCRIQVRWKAPKNRIQVRIPRGTGKRDCFVPTDEFWEAYGFYQLGGAIMRLGRKQDTAGSSVGGMWPGFGPSI